MLKTIKQFFAQPVFSKLLLGVVIAIGLVNLYPKVELVQSLSASTLPDVSTPVNNSATLQPENAPESRILYISSYNRGYAWSDAVEQGIFDRFNASGKKVEIFAEYLDSRRFPPESQAEALARLIETKYAIQRPDVIIVSDNAAFDFAIQYRARLFPDQPIVFCGYNNFRPEVLKGLSNITGVNEEISLNDAVEMALKVHPRTRTLAFITSTGDASSQRNSEVAETSTFPKYRERFSVVVLKDLSLKEVSARLSQLPSDTVLFILGQVSDKVDGRNLLPDENGKLVSAASPFPAYSFWDFYLKTGVLGGHIITGKDQGQAAADLALRILDGTPADSIPVVMTSPASDVFDYPVMVRFGIQPSDLPANAIILARPLSLWEQYRNTIIGTVLAFVILTISLVISLQQNFRRQHAEKNLRQSEEKYRSIFENALEGIFQSTPQGRFLRVNPAVVKMFGYATAAEMLTDIANIGQQVYAHPGDREKIVALMEKDGIIHDYEVECCRRDGSHFWVSDNMYTVRDPDGAILYFEGALLNITERKQAEEALHKSEEKFAKAFQASPMILAITRLKDGYFIEVNEAFEKAIGYTRAEALGHTALELGLLVNPAEHERLVPIMLANGRLRNEEILYRTKSGEVITVLYSAELIELDGEKCFLGTIEDITERKRAEEALRESEDRFRRLANNAPDIIFRYNLVPEMRLVFISPAVEKITFYTPAECYADPLLMLNMAHPDDVMLMAEYLQSRQAPRTPLHMRWLDKFGATHWMESRLVPIYDEANQLVSVEGITRDITERKQAEEALRESEAVYRQAIEVSGAVPYRQIYTRGTLGVHYTFIGEGIRQITGYGPEEFDTELWDSITLERVLLEDLAEYPFEDAVQRVRLGNNPIWKCEHLIRARDGQTHWVFEAAVELRDEHGVSHGSIGLFQDVTVRKQAEAALRENEERFRTLYDNATIGLYRTTPAGRILMLNPAGVHMLGYDSFDEIAQRNLEEQKYQVDYPRKEFREKLEREGTIFGLERQMVKKDGSVIIVRESAKVTRNEKGEALYYDGSFEDITERKRAEEEIRKLNAELEQRVQQRTAELQTVNKELEAFSYSVSHDLRAPLRGINGFTRILQEEYADKLDAEGQSYLRQVQTAGQRMGELIEDLLSLSRLSRSELRHQVIDLGALAQSVTEVLRQREPGREAEIVIAPGMQVYGDERLLRIVLENLIGNAWKFTARHSRARIEVGVTSREGEPTYFVRDDGAGFDMKYADKLFGVFQRLHAADEFEGTGIGLATVQRIIHQHGGRVWAESAVEQGATFYFTLPAQDGR